MGATTRTGRQRTDFLNPGDGSADDLHVTAEYGPDHTLSPDEAYAWRAIERSLRRDLPLRRIERRARFRSDRTLVLAALVTVTGALLGAAALTCPPVLVSVAAVLTVAGFVVGVSRLVRMGLAARRARRSPLWLPPRRRR